jgi:hypothetical protein
VLGDPDYSTSTTPFGAAAAALLMERGQIVGLFDDPRKGSHT